jgi:hypothetical protein
MNKSSFLIICSLLVFSWNVFSQDKTLNNNQIAQEEPSFRKGDVLLIPFDERMYYSEFDRSIAENEGFTFNQIRSKFRKAIDTSLYMNVLVNHSVITLLRKSNPDVDKDIQKLWASLDLSYEEVPLQKNAPKGKFLTKKMNGVSENPDNGHLATPQEEKDKYMAILPNNTEVFKEMNEKYGSNYFIFINQVDIKRAKGTSLQNLEQNDFQKEARLHFTILNLQGNRIASGISIGSFHSGLTKLDDYINNGIMPATVKIAELLPKTEK